MCACVSVSVYYSIVIITRITAGLKGLINICACLLLLLLLLSIQALWLFLFIVKGGAHRQIRKYGAI